MRKFGLRPFGQCDSPNRCTPLHPRQKIPLHRESKLTPNGTKISNTKYYCSPIGAGITHKDTNSHSQFRIKNLVYLWSKDYIIEKYAGVFFCLHCAPGKVSSHSGFSPGNIYLLCLKER